MDSRVAGRIGYDAMIMAGLSPETVTADCLRTLATRGHALLDICDAQNNTLLAIVAMIIVCGDDRMVSLAEAILRHRDRIEDIQVPTTLDLEPAIAADCAAIRNGDTSLAALAALAETHWHLDYRLAYPHLLQDIVGKEKIKVLFYTYLAEKIEREERAELARLKEKYEHKIARA